MKLMLILLGGGLGSVCRFLFTHWAERWFGNGFTWGTLGVNLCGCFLIGLLFAFVEKDLIPQAARLCLITGFLGGLTTFSTYALESIDYISRKEHFWFFFNLVVQNVGGLGLVIIGRWVGRVLG